MAILHLPTPTESELLLRSYREPASSTVQHERRTRTGASSHACERRPSSAAGAGAASASGGTASPAARCSPLRPSPSSRGPTPHHPTMMKLAALAALAGSAAAFAPAPIAASSRTALTADLSKEIGAQLPLGLFDPLGLVVPAARRRPDAAAAVPPSARQNEARAKKRDGGARAVRWADALVTAVHARPRTPRGDVAALYYSRADERCFRREAARDAAAAAVGSGEISRPSGAGAAPSRTPAERRRGYGISQAVVVFGDVARTYGGGVPGGAACAAEAALEARPGPFAFDETAFWNGQLTWS